MQYLMQFWNAEDVGPAEGTPEAAAEMQEWFAYDAEMEAAGIVKGGEALLPAATATTVRLVDGATTTTDGPFAETKEVLGGYYLLEVADLDEAVTWAARSPAARHGSVELRPVMDLSAFTDA